MKINSIIIVLCCLILASCAGKKIDTDELSQIQTVLVSSQGSSISYSYTGIAQRFENVFTGDIAGANDNVGSDSEKGKIAQFIETENIDLRKLITQQILTKLKNQRYRFISDPAESEYDAILKVLHIQFGYYTKSMISTNVKPNLIVNVRLEAKNTRELWAGGGVTTIFDGKSDKSRNLKQWLSNPEANIDMINQHIDIATTQITKGLKKALGI